MTCASNSLACDSCVWFKCRCGLLLPRAGPGPSSGGGRSESGCGAAPRIERSRATFPDESIQLGELWPSGGSRVRHRNARAARDPGRGADRARPEAICRKSRARSARAWRSSAARRRSSSARCRASLEEPPPATPPAHGLRPRRSRRRRPPRRRRRRLPGAGPRETARWMTHPRPILDHLEELRWRLIWIFGVWAVRIDRRELLVEGAVRDSDGSRGRRGDRVGTHADRGRAQRALHDLPEDLDPDGVHRRDAGRSLAPVGVRLARPVRERAPHARCRSWSRPRPCSRCGCLFAYFFAFPAMFGYFVSLEADFVHTSWTTESVFSSCSWHVPRVRALVPAADRAWCRWRSRGSSPRSGSRRSASTPILIAFIVGAILTPSPDATSQMMLVRAAVPPVRALDLGRAR